MSTLDNLKKSAKRWLKAIRANDGAARERLRKAYPQAASDPRLREVQHALARERGYESWLQLRENLADGIRKGLLGLTATDYDSIASDLVAAYDTGRRDAIQRLEHRLGVVLSAIIIRKEVQERLDRLLDSERPAGPFALPHARLLVARAIGYETWDMLVNAESARDPDVRNDRAIHAVETRYPGLAAPIRPPELKPTLPMEMQDGQYSTTTEVWKMLVASRSGDLEQVKELMALTPGLVECYYNYMPPLHLAVREGHVDLVRYLLEKRALNAEDVTYPYNETFLTIADDRGYDEIAALLREYGEHPDAARPRKPNHGPGHIDFNRNGDEEELMRLVNANAFEAVEAFVIERPQLLQDELACGGEGILSAIAHRPNRRMLEVLMRRGARVPDVTKWARAYYFKHYFIAALLLEHGMNPNHMTWHRTTLLHEIVWEGDARKARLLLDYGADIDAVDEEFRSTPLGFAARWNRRDMVQLLLHRGADPNRSGASWATPLAWAEKKGHDKIARDLRTAGAQ